MSEVSTRTLRNYLASLSGGGTAGVVDQDLMIRTDIATTAQAVPVGGATGQVLAKVSGGDYDLGWSDAGSGDMAKAVYDPQAIEADAFARANHTGTQTLSTISDAGTMAAEEAADYTKTVDLAAVALSGAYSDLSGAPSLATVATTGAYSDLSGTPTLGGAAALNVGTTAGTVAAGNHTHSSATTSVAGFLSASDKTKLDGLRSGPYSRGHLWGLTLSNNTTDATNDIDIAIGEARDETDALTMALASALTKRLDANWAAGTNQGGRYSGAAIADTTYHVWLVSKANGADVDVYLDPSAVPATVLTHLQAETGGASYLYVRRIGSILRESGAIVAFTQNGDIFKRAPVVARNSTSAATNEALTLAVPSGLLVFPIVGVRIAASAAGVVEVFFGAGSDASAPYRIASVGTAGSTVPYRMATLPPPAFATNTSRQIYHTFSVSGTAAEGIYQLDGWIDTRGRLA